MKVIAREWLYTIASVLLSFCFAGTAGATLTRTQNAAPPAQDGTTFGFPAGVVNLFIPGGAFQAWYGTGKTWTMISGSGGATIVSCNPGGFGGDPAPNVNKSCYLKTSAPASVITANCAADFGTCNVPAGGAWVAYGAANSFSLKWATAPIGCSPQVFGGDPAPNVPKNCFILTGTTPPTPEAPNTGGVGPSAADVTAANTKAAADAKAAAAAKAAADAKANAVASCKTWLNEMATKTGTRPETLERLGNIVAYCTGNVNAACDTRLALTKNKGFDPGPPYLKAMLSDCGK